MIRWKFTIPIVTTLLSAAAYAENVKLAILSEKPESGIDSPKYLKDIFPACKLALAEMKERLLRAGLHVELDYHPYTYGPISSFETLKKVVTETTDVAAVGFQTTDEVMTAARANAGTDFVALSPYASSSSVLNLLPNYLSLTASGNEQTKIIEKFVMHDLHAKRVAAIVAWDSKFSKDFYETLSANFKSKVRLFKTWDSLSGFEELVPAIIKTNSDVVILPNFPVQTASVIKILSKAGMHPIFVGPDSWGENSDQRFQKIVGDAKFTGYTIRNFSALRRSSEINKFSNRLAKAGATYSVVAGLYHDATLHMLNLIADAPKPVTRAGILELAKERKSFRGVMGRHCISNPICRDREYLILKVTDKGFHFERSIMVPQ